MLEDVVTSEDDSLNPYIFLSFVVAQTLTGSSVSVSVSPAQSSPGVVQIGLSRIRGLPFNDTIAKRRLRRL